MSTHSGVEDAPLIVSGDVYLTGMAPGGAHVRPGGTLHAAGMVQGPLVVDPGGRANISGMLSGSVTLAADAIVDVTGMFTGTVQRNDGQLRAAVGSVIHGEVLTADGTFHTMSSASPTISVNTPRFELLGTGSRLRVGRLI